MLIKVTAYNQAEDTFTVFNSEIGNFEVDAEEIQLSDHDNAEEPCDLVGREFESGQYIETFAYGIG